MSVRIIQGDCRDVLRSLNTASVHCVVTSPPYYGLRDYGTAQWDGGDAGCDHKPPAPCRSSKTTLVNSAEYSSQSWSAYRDTCGKCGARRIDRQIGLEASPDLWITEMVGVMREVRRVLRDDGTVWVNCGDSYNSQNGFHRGEKYMDGGAPRVTEYPDRNCVGLKPKDLLMMPARLALALQADGWWVRSEIVWAKPNPMPESVTDRPTSAHEKVYLLSKSARYFYDAEAVREPHQDKNGTERFVNGCGVGERHATQGWAGGNAILDQHRNYNPAGRNLRNVWTIATAPFPEAHFATYPPELVERCIKAGTSERGCCAGCGKPWVRRAEPSAAYALHLGKGWHDHTDDLVKGQRKSRPGVSRDYVTIGWAPGCQCQELRCTSCCFVLETVNARKASTKHRVSDLPKDVPAMEAGRQVLQPAMSRSGSTAVDRSSVRAVPQDVQTEELSGPLLRQDVRDQVDGAAPQVVQGMVADASGLQVDPEAESSQCEPIWLCDGTPAGNGKEAGQASDQGRGCSPQEWEQVGQSDQQSGTDGEASARPAPKAGLSCDMPALSADISAAWQCPHCGSHAEWTTPNPVPCTILDCFGGSGTTGLVADRLGRDAILIELSPSYCAMAERRLVSDAPLLAEIQTEAAA